VDSFTALSYPENVKIAETPTHHFPGDGMVTVAVGAPTGLPTFSA
jgi:hypothetical protein